MFIIKFYNKCKLAHSKHFFQLIGIYFNNLNTFWDNFRQKIDSLENEVTFWMTFVEFYGKFVKIGAMIQRSCLVDYIFQ